MIRIVVSLFGLTLVLIGGALIIAPLAPMFQLLIGAILLMLGAVIMYAAIFSED